MKRKLFGVLRHAVTMVRRNLRSYRLLSVTIVMSFALLLGYLGFMDSQHYNRFKSTFAQNRNMVFLEEKMDPALAQVLTEKAGEIGNTQSQLLYMPSWGVKMEYPLPDGEYVKFPIPRVYCVPSHVPAIYEYDSFGEWWAPMEITWLDGKEHPDIHLETGEVIVDEQLYHALEMDKSGIFHCMLESSYLDDPVLGHPSEYVRLQGNFTVVGTVPSKEPIQMETFEPTGGVQFVGDYEPIVIVPGTVLGPSLQPDLPWYAYITFVTDSPEQVAQLVNSMFPYNAARAIYESQDRATEIMRTEKGTKAMIGCVLLALLSINLYSSFSNALNDRKFEIGVKRAMGASAFSIVRQFLYESMIVMLADILLAVVIVTDGLLVYKAIYEATPDRWGVYHDWIIYISPYSIAMFVVGSVAMTVVFSLIFAYKSTQVEIVEYLKAE